MLIKFTDEELDDMGIKTRPLRPHEVPTLTQVSAELAATEEGEIEMDKDILNAIPKGPVNIGAPSFTAVKRDGVIEIYARWAIAVNGVPTSFKVKIAEERADGEAK